jgi:hypothetical protein
MESAMTVENWVGFGYGIACCCSGMFLFILIGLAWLVWEMIFKSTPLPPGA